MTVEGTREAETALAVRSGDPERVAREIAELDRIGRYALRPREAVRYRDTYFDTAERELGRRDLALRLRRSEGTTLLGLKTGGRPLPAGGIDRREWEGEWSADVLGQVRAALRERGVLLPSASTPPCGTEAAADPGEVLRSLGLRVIQDRATRRRESGILLPERGEEAGVLAVDAVEFRAADGRGVTHHEVEVEAGGVADPAAFLREVAAALRELFPGVLVPWEHSKLETGRAVAEATAEEGYGAVADPGGRMRPEAYALLTERIAGTAEREGGKGPGDG